MQVFARDPAGNEVVVPVDHQVFPKPCGKSTIPLDDAFLQRVVPAIANNAPDEKIPTDDVLAGFLKINGDLRKKNSNALMELSKKSAPELFFKDAFQQLGNSQVEAKFADTCTYKGKDVDKQVTSASIWPRPRTCRSSRHSAAASCTPPTSASTATASSSITAWACSRCTAPLVDRRQGRATRSRRVRNWAAAA